MICPDMSRYLPLRKKCLWDGHFLTGTYPTTSNVPDMSRKGSDMSRKAKLPSDADGFMVAFAAENRPSRAFLDGGYVPEAADFASPALPQMYPRETPSDAVAGSGKPSIVATRGGRVGLPSIFQRKH